MTVRLVKRGQQVESKNKEAQQPSTSQLVTNTQAWVEEFRARKSSYDAALREQVKLG
jgi:deoxyadenosine/deoxycytidine kinase